MSEFKLRDNSDLLKSTPFPLRALVQMKQNVALKFTCQIQIGWYINGILAVGVWLCGVKSGYLTTLAFLDNI